MLTQYTYSGIPGGRPEDQFVNFLIERKVLVKGHPLSEKAHVKTSPYYRSRS